MDVFRKIDDLRISREWSIYRFCLETDISQQTYMKWMNGSVPTIPLLSKVCEALSITMGDFFAKNGMIEATDDTKCLIENWNYLTKEEKDIVKSIIKSYANKNK